MATDCLDVRVGLVRNSCAAASKTGNKAAEQKTANKKPPFL